MYGFLYAFFIFLWRYKAINANNKDLPINDDIKVKEVRMVSETGEQLGIMSLNDAKEYAYSRDLDIVMMSATAVPPVCKAMNYGKYCFDRLKREREARKNQQVIKVKEVQLSCRIDTHDFETRVNQARKFLTGGDKVKVVIRFRGRELAHTEIGYAVIEKFIEACKPVGETDKKPVIEGKIASVIISPAKTK